MSNLNVRELVEQTVAAIIEANPEDFRSQVPGPTGEPLTIEETLFLPDGSMQLSFSDGTIFLSEPLFGPDGEQGVQGEKGDRGVSVHHSRFTATTNPDLVSGAVGQKDTYTIYGDPDETVVLGWFTVTNGADGEDPYDYAVEDGYEGSREEFYEDFAENATNIEEIRNLVDIAEHLVNTAINKLEDLADLQDLVDEVIQDVQENRDNIQQLGERVDGHDVAIEAAEGRLDDLEEFEEEARNELDSLAAGKVDKEDGKGLSETSFTQDEKDKLAALESSKFKGFYPNIQVLEYIVEDPQPGDYADVAEGIDGQITRYFYDSEGERWEPQIGESTQLTGSQIKALYESQPDTNAFTDAQKSKLAAIESDANKIEAGEGIRDLHNVYSVRYGTEEGTALEGDRLTQEMGYSPHEVPSQKAVQLALDEKLEAEEGKGLSSNDFTDEERDKLAGLESSMFRGFYPSLEVLLFAVENPVAGNYADVDQGEGNDVVRYIYNSPQERWVKQAGEFTNLSGSQIKELYEAQTNTNAFTDNEKNKLAGIESGATKITAGTGLTKTGSTLDVKYGVTSETALEGDRLVQESGNAVDKVMSQKAVTEMVGSVPSVRKISTYTAVSLDAGKSIDTIGNVIIPANTFLIGDVITVTCDREEPITVSPAAGVTFRVAGTPDTGPVVIGDYAVITLRMVSNNNWRVIGIGIQ